MTTQADALNWVTQQVGKSLDFDGMYGAQCVDLVAYYCQFLGIGPLRANARYWWENGYDGGGNFIRANSPQPGDIVVFAPNAGNGQSGHIAIVHDVRSTDFTSLDQNWVNANLEHGSPAAWVKHPINNSIYGYLRPKFNGGQDMPEKINQGTSRILQHGILARNAVAGRSYSLDGSTGDPWVGGELTNQFINDIFASSEAARWRDSQDPDSVSGINDRLNRTATLEQELTNERASYDQQIADLKKQLAAVVAPTPPDPNSITISKDSLWEKIKKFLTS